MMSHREKNAKTKRASLYICKSNSLWYALDKELLDDAFR